MRKEIITLSLLAVLGAFKQPVKECNNDPDFALVQTSKNVSLFEKWYTISGNIKARELKAEFTIKASIASVIAMLQKESEGKKWNSNASKFQIKDVTAAGWVNYIEYDLPWPMDNQDCVLKHTRSDLGTVASVIGFTSTSHASFPESKNVSRIGDVKGNWILNKSGESTRVEYYITTTPSATLPRAVTDPIVRGNIINTMASFRDLLEK